MQVNKTVSPLNVTTTPTSPQGTQSVPDFAMPSQQDLQSGDSQYYFNLMQQMQQQTQAYQAMVEILKAKHSASMAAIQNMGS